MHARGMRNENEREEMQVTIENITPRIAKMLLESHPLDKQRDVRVGRVKALSKAMLNGEWVANGESIKLHDEGWAGDGQHRLYACIESGVTLTDQVVVRGLTDAAFDTVDDGGSRNDADVLKRNGVPKSKTIAPGVRAFLLYKSGGLRAKTGVTKTMVRDFVLENKDRCLDSASFTDSTHKGAQKRYPPVLDKNVLFLAHFVLSERSRTKGESFIMSIVKGESSKKGDPAIAFRNEILRIRSEGVATPRHMTVGMMFRAWNCYKTGGTMNEIHYIESDSTQTAER